MSDIAKMIAIAKKFGGGSSAPAPVVILPETELTVVNVEEGSNGQYVLTTPLENTPSVGGTYKMVWGGVEYTSKGVELPSDLFGMQSVALGNTDYLGLDDVENPGADMPILVVLFPDGVIEDPDDPVMYCMAVSMGITPDPPVLSIVQTEGAAGDGNVGGGGELFVVNATTADGSTVTVDKTYDEIATAVSTKKFGICCLDLMGTQTLYLPFAVITQNTFVFSAHVPNIDAAVTVNSDGTSNLDFTMLT